MILVTGGCSFSATKTGKNCWPHWLEKQTKFNAVNTGSGSEGNGMISRRIIHAVHKQLKHTSADNILVGIMWSGPSRHEQYSSEKIDFNGNIDGWMENPTSYADQDPGGWIIYNNRWKIKQAQRFYRYMYDPVYSQVLTLEHIIRTQNYLKLHNIKYFMTTYMDEVFALTDNNNLDHLYEQIDYEYFLTNQGMLEWTRTTGLQPRSNGDHHPTTEMHELYTNKIIIPWIKQKYKIDINA